MNTKQQNTEYHYRSAVASKENLQHLTSAGWSIAKASLFYLHNYNENEMEKITGFINRSLSNANDPYLAYLEFCQRILLAHEYLKRFKGGTLSTHALIWLRSGKGMGFGKTKQLYNKLLKIRKTKPLWKKEWKELAEAVLDLVEGPLRENFEYWVNWFRERRAQEEINMLNNLISSRHLKTTML